MCMITVGCTTTWGAFQSSGMSEDEAVKNLKRVLDLYGFLKGLDDHWYVGDILNVKSRVSP